MESEVVDQGTTIASLPPQLLTQILRQLSTQERLCCCALVSRAWHKAALAATTSIEGSEWPPEKVTNFSGWLEAHAAATAVSSIAIAAEVHPPPLDILKLPSQQLKSLRSLHLSRLVVKPAGADAQTAAALLARAVGETDTDKAAGSSILLPILTPELAALTHLSCDDCLVNLEGLITLTDLRSLSLKYSRYFDVPGGLHSRNIEALAAALPLQSQVTALQLHGEYCDAEIVAAAGALPALQTLRLAGALGAADLAELPLSLTSLYLECWHANDVDRLFVTAAATPRLCQLTSLQELSVQYVEKFHPAVLAEMHDLRTLSVDCSTIDKELGELGLEVLTRLTKLQSIHLSHGHLEADLATADGIAALTSPTELTRLDVLAIPTQYFSALFPEGRQMPRLLELSLNEQLLLQHETLSRVVISCPNLTRLVVHALEDPEQQQAAPIFPVQVSRALRHLTALQHLQALQLGWCPLSVECWQTIAALPCLKQLVVLDGELSTAEGLMAMTECRGLTSLEMELYPVMPAGYDARFTLEVQDQAPTGSPPDVWSRLPAAVNGFALEIVERDDAGPNDEVLSLFRHLTASAAAAMGSIQTEQQQEVLNQQQELLNLRERTAALEAARLEQQQQTAMLQQQMWDMQAAMQQLMLDRG